MKRPVTLEFSGELVINGHATDVDFIMKGNYVPAERGTFERGGLQITPDEPAMVEDMEVYAVAGRPPQKLYVTDWLTEKQLGSIEDNFLEDPE